MNSTCEKIVSLPGGECRWECDICTRCRRECIVVVWKGRLIRDVNVDCVFVDHMSDKSAMYENILRECDMKMTWFRVSSEPFGKFPMLFSMTLNIRHKCKDNYFNFHKLICCHLFFTSTMVSLKGLNKYQCQRWSERFYRQYKMACIATWLLLGHYYSELPTTYILLLRPSYHLHTITSLFQQLIY